MQKKPLHAANDSIHTRRRGAGRELKPSNGSTARETIFSCDWLLHSAESWQKAIPDVLEIIGTSFGFNRVRLFRNDAGAACATLLYRWTAADFATDRPETALQKLDYADNACEHWCSLLRQGQPVLSTLHDASPQEQECLKRQGLGTLILAPVFCGDIWWGFITGERQSGVEKATPHELGVLLSAGRSIGTAIQRETLNRQLQQIMTAFDHTAEGIVITDERGRITAVNKSTTEITGYSEQELLRTTHRKLCSNRHDRVFFADVRRQLQHEGGWRGDIWSKRKSGEIYPARTTIVATKDKDGKLLSYVAVLADISEVQQARQELHQMANRDPLTGLPNRRLLNELLEHAIRRAEREKDKIALLFIDLDRFKSINDTLGHPVGDKLLAEVATRLTGTVRDSDTVAHLGSDEFVVMMDCLRETEDAAVVARKIIHALSAEFAIDGNNFFIGASIGISIHPNDGQQVDDLIKAADIAMYKIKNDGRNNYRFYSSDLSISAFERFNLETLLRQALKRDQFEVHYQPQISLASGRIVGAEALIRWRHPDLGLVPPDKFIPLAEECGMIVQIGEWILRQAAYQAMQWAAQKYSLQWISVNVSAIQIQRSNFVDTVCGVLLETDCQPSLLELEITESTIMHNTDEVISMFSRIKELGVRLAIDDFGTGYSSLSHLKRLPLDKLKIDKSFVNELPHNSEDAAISRAIQALGSSLGLTVIAEGVEKPEQAAFLNALGCDEAQGYLYSRPVPAEEFARLLAAQN